MQKKLLLITALLCFSTAIIAQNVGIGTRNPTTKLDITGKTKTDSLFVTGYVGIGNSFPQHRLTVGNPAVADAQSVSVRAFNNALNWKGGAAFGYTAATVIMGELNGVATIGGHNSDLSVWANLAINPTGVGSVSIGTATVNTSAKLEVSSTIQGFLPPRMTSTQRDAIASPAQGLMIFCTDCRANRGEPEYYTGSTWVNMTGAPAKINFSIGDSDFGGTIAYISQPGDPGYIAGETHGLIAAPADQSTGATWGCFGSNIGGTSTAFGTGKANTTAIVAGCATPGIAASLCKNLSLNGYSDWYLPSKDELNKLYLNKDAIGGFDSSSSVAYWTSNQLDAYAALFQTFSNGNQSTNGKGATFKVRAIRSF